MASVPPVESGQIVSVLIDRAGPGGFMLANIDEYVVYVHGGKIGQNIKVRIRKVGRTYAEADAMG